MAKADHSLVPEARLRVGTLRHVASEVQCHADRPRYYRTEAESFRTWARRLEKSSYIFSDTVEQLRELRAAAGCTNVDHVTARDTIAQQAENINDLSERLVMARHDLEKAERDKNSALDESAELNQRVSNQATTIETYQNRVQELQDKLDNARAAESHAKEDYEAAKEVLNEVRDALGAPDGPDIVVDIVEYAKQIVGALNQARQNREDALQEREQAVQRAKVAAEEEGRAIRYFAQATRERDDAHAVLKQVRDALGLTSSQDVIEAARVQREAAENLQKMIGEVIDERDKAQALIRNVRHRLDLPEDGDVLAVLDRMIYQNGGAS